MSVQFSIKLSPEASFVKFASGSPVIILSLIVPANLCCVPSAFIFVSEKLKSPTRKVKEISVPEGIVEIELAEFSFNGSAIPGANVSPLAC